MCISKHVVRFKSPWSPSLREHPCPLKHPCPLTCPCKGTTLIYTLASGSLIFRFQKGVIQILTCLELWLLLELSQTDQQRISKMCPWQHNTPYKMPSGRFSWLLLWPLPPTLLFLLDKATARAWHGGSLWVTTCTMPQNLVCSFSMDVPSCTI